MKCTICNSELKLKFETYDDRYGYYGLFLIKQCQNCKHIMLDSDFSSEQLIELYSKYYPRTTLEIDSYKPSPLVKGFKAWLNGEQRSAYTWVPEKVTILDIGCGFGETLGYHSARGCNVYGVEADANIKRVAQKFGFNVHFGLFDPNIYKTDYFDFVTMDQVIEHVQNPIETLKGISKILKNNGTLILGFPNANGWGAKLFGKRWINWHTPYHLNFFSLTSLQLAAEKAGLKVNKIKTIASSDWLCYQLIHLFLYPKMGEPSVFWKPGQRINTKAKIVIRLVYLIHKSKILHLITRLFDLISMGDGYLIFLKKKDE